MSRPILAIGGASLDRTYVCANPPSLETSNPVTSRRSHGGVARNVAETVARLGARARLITAVGEDEAGRALATSLAQLQVDMGGLVTISGKTTAEYTAAFWQGELFAGFADMDIFEALSPECVGERLPNQLQDWLVFADCNLPWATLAMLARRAAAEHIYLAIDCVSLAKSERLPRDLSGVSLLTVNADQVRHIAGKEAVPAAVRTALARGCGAIVLTLGANGLIVHDGKTELSFKAPVVPVISVSGAGDALAAGILLGLSEGRELTDCIPYGLAATALSLQSFDTVPSGLSRQTLEAAMRRLRSNPGTPDVR